MNRAPQTVSLHKYVLDQLEASKGTWPSVAEETGISIRTIEKIAREEVENPGVKTVEQLARHFQQKSQHNSA